MSDVKSTLQWGPPTGRVVVCNIQSWIGRQQLRPELLRNQLRDRFGTFDTDQSSIQSAKEIR